MCSFRAGWHGFRKTAAQKDGSVLLEDACGGESYFFTDPIEVLEVRDLAGMADLFSKIDASLRKGHYVAGFMSYEAGYAFEERLQPLFQTTVRPRVAWFGVYTSRISFNSRAETAEYKNDVEARGEIVPCLTMDVDEETYAARVRRIHEWIERGDTYQANLTTAVRWQNRMEPDELLGDVLRAQPVQFGALLNVGDCYIISASPELFFRRVGPHIYVQPMKGTAPRGRTLEEDEHHAAWLAQDEKNRAENLMIVDLLRNDLGRICKFGSIRTENLFRVSRLPTVFQMTSDIMGTLRDDISSADIFRALFPSGSIVGAPKMRTMEILRDLESCDRGVYTGCIGYFAPGDRSVFSVAIRTIVLEGRDASMGVGSGVVYDSEASSEYAECWSKTRFLTEIRADFRLIETILWDGRLMYLSEHLARIKASAAYFDFAFEEARVMKSLQEVCIGFNTGEHHRVRLLLAKDGSVGVESTPIGPPDKQPVRVLIAKQRTAARDRFRFHKTTFRTVYDNAYRRAQLFGCADAIFFNEEGHLTEGSINNIVLTKNGVSRTPALDCGLLPGILRAQLLRSKAISEAVLTLGDLLGADKIFLCNSVRGMRPVERVLTEDEDERPERLEGSCCWSAPAC